MGFRSTTPSDLRSAGTGPTSEAWEACCRQLKTHKLAAFCRFSVFSDGFQLEQPGVISAASAFKPTVAFASDQQQRADPLDAICDGLTDD